MSDTAFLRVPEMVARNPVARAIEKANMKRWLTSVQIEMELLKDGDPAKSLIAASVETLAVAIKTLEGWAEDGGLREVMTDAIVCLEHMAHRGYVWNVEATGKVSEAVDYACQVLAGMSAQDKQRAWAWAQEQQRKAKEPA